MQLQNWSNKQNWYDLQLLCKVNETQPVVYLGTYTFNGSISTQYDSFPYYDNVEIIQRQGKVIGILRYHVEFYKRKDYEDTKHTASYFLFNDIQRGSIADVPDLDVAMIKNEIKIEASKPLIDERRPFMYAIQNAFDGNPATSYVEDTEDDLMKITGAFFDFFTCSKISFVNGYAASEDLFKSNSRIKRFFYTGTAKEGYEELDKNFYEVMTNIRNKPIQDIRKRQIFSFIEIPLKTFYFTVDEIYQGTKYTDTCLSELDFYTKEYGWLFGGIDE